MKNFSFGKPKSISDTRKKEPIKTFESGSFIIPAYCARANPDKSLTLANPGRARARARARFVGYAHNIEPSNESAIRRCPPTGLTFSTHRSNRTTISRYSRVSLLGRNGQREIHARRPRHSFSRNYRLLSL